MITKPLSKVIPSFQKAKKSFGKVMKKAAVTAGAVIQVKDKQNDQN